MKILLIAFLFAALAFCQVHYFHHNGTVYVNDEHGVTFGQFYVELHSEPFMTYISGMYVKDRVHTPFEFSAKITSYKTDGHKISIEASIVEGRWKQQSFTKVSGIMGIEGTWDAAKFILSADVTKPKLSLNITADGIKSKCAYYSMQEAASRAGYLVGEKAENYKPEHVLNHAIFGYPYFKGKNIKYYHNTFGTIVASPKPGVIVVGNDSAHCAIIDKEGDKFIQSNPIKKEVTINPITMLKDFFQKGYILKEYKC